MKSFSGKWNPEKQSYKNACLRLSKDLSKFKVDPEYIPFVGNDTRPAETVNAFYQATKGMEYVSDNDRIGSPILHNGMSAGTLRFMKVYKDITSRFSNFKVVTEIGAGYGGQRLIFGHYTKPNPINYQIIDIPESLELSKAYLKANGYDSNTKFISSENVPSIITDILISDYCLSEFDKDGIDFYLDKIKFKFGYFTLNGQFDYIKETLEKRGYLVEIEDENPPTSRHKNKIYYATKVK